MPIIPDGPEPNSNLISRVGVGKQNAPQLLMGGGNSELAKLPPCPGSEARCSTKADTKLLSYFERLGEFEAQIGFGGKHNLFVPG